jgi:hypothetical protein
MASSIARAAGVRPVAGRRLCRHDDDHGQGNRPHDRGVPKPLARPRRPEHEGVGPRPWYRSYRRGLPAQVIAQRPLLLGPADAVARGRTVDAAPIASHSRPLTSSVTFD